jgi:hypothetical protein
VVFDSADINCGFTSSDVDGGFQSGTSLLLFNNVIFKFDVSFSFGGQTVLLLDLSFGQGTLGAGDFLVSE